MCYTFLKSGKNPSDHQEELPSKQVDREAMAYVMRELYQELSALKSKAQILPQKEANETSEATQSANGIPESEQRESDATDAFFDAAELGENMSEPPPERSAPNAAKTPSAATQVQSESGVPESGEIARERPRLCRVNWGKFPCPATEDGSQCTFAHKQLCNKPECLISENRGDCTLWHGHLRGLLQREKAKKKRAAEMRATEREAQKEQNQPGNGIGRGKRSTPHQPRHAPKAQTTWGQHKSQRRPANQNSPRMAPWAPQVPVVQDQTPTISVNTMEQFHQVQLFLQFQKFLSAGAIQQQLPQQGAF